MKKAGIIILILLFGLFLNGCDLIQDFGTNIDTTVITPEESTDDELYEKLNHIYQLAVDSESFDGTYEEWLESVRGPKGDPGEDGREVIFQVSEGYIQWRYSGESVWTNLISLDNLSGEQGISITGTSINESGELIITYSDDTETNLGIPVVLYTVIFEDYNGYIIDSQRVPYGTEVIPPDDPNREGHTFTGWSEDYSNITDDLRIQAQYTANTYTVTFHPKGGTEIDPLNDVVYGSTLTLPAPEKEGYDFKGWYLSDDVTGESFYSTSKVKSNLDLYAKWDISTYLVRFVDYDGSVLYIDMTEHGTSSFCPATPSRVGYRFTGWDQSYDIITNDMDITATYEPKEYTISFMTDEHDLIEDMTVFYEEGIPVLPTPKKTGYAFMGWYEDSSLTELFTETYMPPKNVTLYPSFNKYPELSSGTNAEHYIGINTDFDPASYIRAFDEEDGLINENVQHEGFVDTSTEGTYIITYIVTDSSGLTSEMDVTFHVGNQYFAQGFYNFKYASPDVRCAFFGAAERYLLDTMAGGVPLFANAGFSLYSNRMTLPVEDYVPVMGFGVSFGSMTADDSTVNMANGDPGEAGEYTYRTTLSGNPETLNQWLYEGSVTSDLMDMYMDAMYVYEFNDDKTGYDVVPSMATDMPQPEDPEVLDSGKEVSNVWQISIRDDLEWYFHPDTLAEQGVDPSTFTDTTIDANDFVDTYKYAIDNDWFRAIFGGGDFFAPSQRIKNAEEYHTDPNATPWSEVGIKVIDDNTMEFEFVNDMFEWEILQWLSSFVMTPINFDLYDALEPADGDNPYGTLNPTTIAYNGPYYIDYLEQDKLIRLKRNPNFYDPQKFFYDGYEMQIIEDAAMRFQEFEAGRLDAVGVPTEEYENYQDHPGLKRIPGATTFRLTLNGFGSVEAQQQTFPESDYVPEPILGNLNFRKALFFAIDRERLATEILKTSQPNMYMFSSAYLLNGDTGIPFRNTVEGMEVGNGLSPETYGYDPDTALAYWELAVSEEIAAGNYEAGTASEPTIIPLELHIFSGSQGQALYGQYIKSTFDSLFQSDENNIQVEVTVSPKDFPGIYFDYMMTGEFDMSTGGIQGSTLDAASFLDVFCTDNRGGFTLSWGVDTSQPDILVEYTDADGVDRAEYWSYDAIVSALNQEVFVLDGMEVDTAQYYADQLSIDLFHGDSDVVELPATIGESTVEWAIINNDQIASLDGHTLSFSTVTTDEIVTLEATITYPVDGEDPIVITRTFEVTVSADASGIGDLIAYYDDAEGLTGAQLLEQLRIILNETIDRVTYGEARYMLNETDADPDQFGNVILVYTGDSVSGTWDFGATWNREHVWPQSAMPNSASNSAANIASDLHGLKPADPSENSFRSNKFFGEGEAGSYEPRDEVKGDIARIMLYMIVMYEELSLVDNIPNTSNYEMGLFTMLLEWHEADPVDEFEENRNEEIFGFQGNRNPFIDYPEFVEMIWGPF